jgi:RHS repeat-associated protein
LNPTRTTLKAFVPAQFVWLLQIVCLLFSINSTSALPAKLGDLDSDGIPTAKDVVAIVNHINGTPRLSNEGAVFADVNQDGVVNELDVNLVVDAIMGVSTLPDFVLTQVLDTSPVAGEAQVSVTRETTIRFTQPLATNTVLTTASFFAEFGGRKIGSRAELSPDRRKATLFYSQERLPGNARIRVTLVAGAIRDFAGRLIDADGDGLPGGNAVIEFDTLSQTPLTNTIVLGRIFASELATGTNNGTNISINVPLQGVVVTADGLEQTVRATSDQFGNFRLTNAPAGPFFVHIDGHTVINLSSGIRYPDLSYYPLVGKLWESIPGGETNIGEVYLPRIAAATLTTVSPTNDTLITFPPSVLANNTNLAGVSLTVPANSLFSDDGQRGGKVGIAPVPPDRLPGPLPNGLGLPLVITVQTDGPQNFSQPVPVCFPNLPDPITGIKLPPGAKTALWSFDHNLGIWVIRGPMTVSEDGNLACSDPGVGLLSPGWHGVAPFTGCPDGDCITEDPNPDQGPIPPKFKTHVNSDNPMCPPVVLPEDPTDPVNLYSGELQETFEDLRVKGVGLDFVWRRTYRSNGPEGRVGLVRSSVGDAAILRRYPYDLAYDGNPLPLGLGWDHSYNIYLKIGLPQYQSLTNARTIVLYDGTGRKDRYLPRGNGTWTLQGFFRQFTVNPDDTLTLTFEDQTKWNFEVYNSPNHRGRITSIVDRNGNSMRFTYANNLLTKITDTLGRDYTLHYDNDFGWEIGGPRLISLTDFAGRQVRYGYGPAHYSSAGFLKTVTLPSVTGTPNGNDFPNGQTTTYTYTPTQEKLWTITDARGNLILENTYNESYRTKNPRNAGWGGVVRQVWGGAVVDITYVAITNAPENNNAITKTIVNDRNGNVKEYFYDAGNRCTMMREYTGRANPVLPTTETQNRPTGKLRASDPDYFETRFEYNSDYKRTRTIHPNGNITENIYEADLNGAAPARSRGNLREIRHLPGSHTPRGDQSVLIERFEYGTNFAGCCGFNFVTKHTDARGNVTLFQYDDFGNLIARTNTINSVVDRWDYNARGQMVSHTFPDNGNNSRRVDVKTYYAAGPQNGYLKDEIADFNGLRLTTTYEHDARGNITRMIDPRGHDTQYVFNQLDQVVRQFSPEVTTGSGIRYQKDFFYDANNNLVRLDVQNRDENGVVQANAAFTTTYDYEMLNNLTRKTEEVDATRNVITEYAYDGNRNRVLIRHGEATAGRQTNNVVQMLYDERNLLFREVRAPGSPGQSTTQFDYDGNKNRIRQWQGLEASPHLTTYLHDAFNRLVSLLDPMGNVATNHFDANGNRTNTVVLGELIDLAGSTNNIRLSESFFGYDAMNRQTNQTLAFFNPVNQTPIGDGAAVTRTIYADNSQILAVINDNSHGTTNQYDSVNRLRTRTDAKGNSVTFDYDADSNVTVVREVEKPDLGGPDEQFGTTNVYDNLNRLIAATDNIGNLNRSGYDSRNNRTVTFDALTNKVVYAYDGLNRQLSTTRLMTDNGVGSGTVVGQIVTRQTWDDTSRLTSQIDDNLNATTYVYDGLDRKIATVFADGTGQTNFFDVHHHAVQSTDGNGNIISNAFDDRDRLVRRDIVCGPGVATNTTFELFKYDGLDRLVHAQDNGSLVTRRYDSLSRLVAEVQNGQTVTSVFDGVGNRTQCTYPSGRVITETYDELERLKTITDGSGLIASYAYVGPVRVAQRDQGNGTRAAYTYDGISGISNPTNDFGVRQIIRTRHTRIADASVIDDRTYTWDRMGSKTGRRDMRAGGAAHDYGYDSIYRLRQSVATPTSGPIETIGYNLDGVGNRLSVSGGTNAGAYTLSAALPEPADFQLNQYTTTPFDARRADKNGNLATINFGLPTEQAFGFDYRNRMVSYTNRATSIGATYAYDALGRRIVKRLNSGSAFAYRYEGFRICEEQNDLGATLASYVYGNYVDELISLRRGTTNLFYHVDDLYTATALSDSFGNRIEGYEYTDFGTPSIYNAAGAAISISSFGNHQCFNGTPYDAETGLSFYRSRYLNNNFGRFLSRDSLGTWWDQRSLGNPVSYVSNNPWSLVDPFGFDGVFSLSAPPGSAAYGYVNSPTGKSIAANAQLNGYKSLYNNSPAREFYNQNKSLFSGVIGMGKVTKGFFDISTGWALTVGGLAGNLTGVGAVPGILATTWGVHNVVGGADSVVSGSVNISDAINGGGDELPLLELWLPPQYPPCP